MRTRYLNINNAPKVTGDHVCHMRNVTRSIYNHFILKLCVSYISTGELRHRCYDVNCFSGTRKGLSSLQASDCSHFHMYVIVANALLTLLFFFSRHGALGHGSSFFSSLMGEKQLPGSGHTSNRRLCPR